MCRDVLPTVNAGDSCVNRTTQGIGEIIAIPERGYPLRRTVGEVSLPELVERVALALTEMRPGSSVLNALSILSRGLGPASETAAAKTSRSRAARRVRQTAVESLPLFS